MSFNSESVTTTSTFNGSSYPYDDHQVKNTADSVGGGAFPLQRYPIFPHRLPEADAQESSSESDGEEVIEEGQEEKEASPAKEGGCTEEADESTLVQKTLLPFPKMVKSSDGGFLVAAKTKKKVTTEDVAVAPGKQGNSIIDIVENRKKSRAAPKVNKAPSKKSGGVKKRRETAAEKEIKKRDAYFALMASIYEYSKYQGTMEGFSFKVPF